MRRYWWVMVLAVPVIITVLCAIFNSVGIKISWWSMSGYVLMFLVGVAVLVGVSWVSWVAYNQLATARPGNGGGTGTGRRTIPGWLHLPIRFIQVFMQFAVYAMGLVWVVMSLQFFWKGMVYGDWNGWGRILFLLLAIVVMASIAWATIVPPPAPAAGGTIPAPAPARDFSWVAVPAAAILAAFVLLTLVGMWATGRLTGVTTASIHHSADHFLEEYNVQETTGTNMSASNGQNVVSANNRTFVGDGIKIWSRDASQMILGGGIEFIVLKRGFKLEACVVDSVMQITDTVNEESGPYSVGGYNKRGGAVATPNRIGNALRMEERNSYPLQDQPVFGLMANFSGRKQFVGAQYWLIENNQGAKFAGPVDIQLQINAGPGSNILATGPITILYKVSKI